MNYVDLFTRAVRLCWRNKAIWLLGMVAVLCGQGESGFSFNFSFSGNNTPARGGGDPEEFIRSFLAQPLVVDFLAHPYRYIVLLVAAMLIWWLATSLVGWWMQGAMIQLAAQADQGAAPSLGESLRASRARVWPLFGMYVLVSLPNLLVLALALLIMVPMMLSLLTSGDIDPARFVPQVLGSVLCLIPLFLLVALAGIVLRVWDALAARACVIEQLPIRASFRAGWDLLRRNFLLAGLNWFALLLVNGVFSFLVALPSFALLFPVGRAVFTSEWTAFTTGMLIVAFVYLLIASVAVGGVLASFSSTLWTLFYQSLRRPADAQPLG